MISRLMRLAARVIVVTGVAERAEFVMRHEALDVVARERGENRHRGIT